jgi:hypothetical protein
VPAAQRGWSLGEQAIPAFPCFQKVAKPIDDGASLSRHHTANFSFRLQAALSWAPTVAGWSEIVSLRSDRTLLRGIVEKLWRLLCAVQGSRRPRGRSPELPAVSPTCQPDQRNY